MKDIQTPLRELFESKLNARQIANYENGAVPDGAETPYVIISSMDDSENSNKSDFGHSIFTLLDIVTSYPKNQLGSSKLADTIAGYILEDINSKTKLDLSTGLQIVNTKVMQDQKIGDKTPTKVIYRRLIRFQQLIMEV